jgi:hypothetical protein
MPNQDILPQLEINLYQKKDKNQDDYYASNFSMFSARFAAFVWLPKDKEGGEGFAAPGFLQIQSFKDDQSEDEQAADIFKGVFKIPLFVVHDANGDEYLFAKFRIMGVVFKAIVFHPPVDDKENLTGPGKLIIKKFGQKGA